MRRPLPSAVLRLLSFSVAALAVAAPMGCGGDESTGTGTQVEIPQQEAEAQNAMENFMKSQGQAKKK
jgi:hypothetical protein